MKQPYVPLEYLFPQVLLFGFMTSQRYRVTAFNLDKVAGRARNTPFLCTYVKVLIVCVRISTMALQDSECGLLAHNIQDRKRETICWITKVEITL